MLQGSMVALVTPMTVEGEIDYKNLEKLLSWHLEKGTNGFVILGTTGESATIDAVEREHIIRFVIAYVNKQVPVIVGTGSNSTKHAIQLTKQAFDLSADGALVVTPYYNKPTQTGLFEHYAAIAKTVSIPLILYNVPGRTGCDLLPDTVARLAAFSNIIGLKDATGNIDRIKALMALNLPMHFYSGDDGTALEFMKQGGVGVISVAANIFPAEFYALCKYALEKDFKTATLINQQLQPLFDVLMIESNPIPTKWLLSQMEFISAGIRLPLTKLSSTHHEKVWNAYQHCVECMAIPE